MFRQIAVATALAIVASSSFAAYDDPVRIATPTNLPARYVGGDAGVTKLGDKSDGHNSYGLFVGVEFAPGVALEVGARRLGKFDICCAHAQIDQGAVSLVGILPLDSNLKIFGRVGYNKLKFTPKLPHSETDSISGGLVGLGVGISLSPSVVARAEFQKPSNDLSNFSIGLMIKY